MANERTERVAAMYLKRNVVAQDIEGDVHETAVAWLSRADDELGSLEPLLAARQWRVAYNTAYDLYRHAAEAIDLDAGFRLLSAGGAHEAAFALAAAIIEGHSDVFDAASALQIRATRNRLEYVSPEATEEITEADARWAAQLAGRAIAAASSFLD